MMTTQGTYSINGKEVRSGRLGVKLDNRGQPASFTFYAPNGERLKSTIFTPENLLTNAQKYGIDIRDSLGLGAGLDAAGVGYRPGELYKGTGSNHGIDFNDLVQGGYGTSYNWADDPNAALKGPTGKASLQQNQRVAENLGLTRSSLTSASGNPRINLDSLTQLSSKGRVTPYAVQSPSGSVSFYETAAAAQDAQQRIGGQVINLSDRPVVNQDNRNNLRSVNGFLQMAPGTQSANALNPFQLQMFNAVTQQVTDNFNRNVLPGITSAAVSTGGFGGSRQGVVEANAMKDLNQGLTNTLGNIQYTDWNNYQNRLLQNKGLNNSYNLGLGWPARWRC